MVEVPEYAAVKWHTTMSEVEPPSSRSLSTRDDGLETFVTFMAFKPHVIALWKLLSLSVSDWEWEVRGTPGFRG
jgi:hypothetical protein